MARKLINTYKIDKMTQSDYGESWSNWVGTLLKSIDTSIFDAVRRPPQNFIHTGIESGKTLYKLVRSNLLFTIIRRYWMTKGLKMSAPNGSSFTP